MSNGKSAVEESEVLQSGQKFGWLRSPFSTSLLGVPVGIDIYLRNAYRVLGLPANATSNVTARQMDRLKAMSKLSSAAVQRIWIRNGYESHLTSEEALHAVSRLKDPRQRLVNELFWPHLLDGLSERLTQTRSLDDSQLQSELQTIAAQKNGTAGALAKHSLAILYHNLALRDELAAADGLAKWSDQYWRLALSLWGETLANKHFWEYMTERVRSYDDPRVRPADLAEMRNLLWRVLLDFNSLLARSHAENNTPLSNGHLLLISRAACPSDILLASLAGTVKAIANKKLAPIITQAQAELVEHKTKLKWPEFRKRCDAILQLASGVITFLSKDICLSAEVMALAEFDALADAICAGLNACVEYTFERERALLLSSLIIRQLLQFPMSKAGRNKLQSQLRQDREHLFNKEFVVPDDVDPTECWFLPGEWADPEASIVKPVYKITKLNAATIQWSPRKVLIPRSAVAWDLHRGRKPKGGFSARANTPAAQALNKELEEVRDKAAKAEKEFEQKRDALWRQIQEQYAPKLQQAQKEIDQAQAKIDPELAATEAERKRLVNEERARLEQQLKGIRVEYAEKIAQAKQTLEEKKAGKGESSKMLALTLGTTGTILGGGAGVLLTGSGLVPESVGTSTVAAAGACLGALLGGTSIMMLRKAAIQSAARAVEKLQKMQDSELERTRAASNKNVEKIDAQNKTRVAQIKAQVTTLQQRRQELEETMRKQFAKEDEKLQSQMAAARKESEKKAKKLEEKLAAMLNPKAESAAYDWPAYQSAKSQGFQDGEKPSDSEAQAMMSRELERLVARLSYQDRLLLQAMLQQSPGRQADVLQAFLDMRGYN